MHCDDCTYYEYDEDDETYYCGVNMDEDDYAKLMNNSRSECPYYRNNNEYEVVKHQM
jgi:hypothetical protein